MREPGKAARLHLEDDDDLVFEFFLAQKLGMTRARLITEMSNLEFVYWSRHYDRIAQARELEERKAGLTGG
jgi:hypothetical protein